MPPGSKLHFLKGDLNYLLFFNFSSISVTKFSFKHHCSKFSKQNCQ